MQLYTMLQRLAALTVLDFLPLASCGNIDINMLPASAHTHTHTQCPCNICLSLAAFKVIVSNLTSLQYQIKKILVLFTLLLHFEAKTNNILLCCMLTWPEMIAIKSINSARYI